MRPVGVVDRSKIHIVLVAHQRRHHHMRTVQRMHLPIIIDARHYEIRRECRALSSRQYRQHITTHQSPSYPPLVHLHLHILHRRRNVVHILPTIRLDDGQSKRRDPAHRTIGVSNDRGNLVQPCHNGGSTLICHANRPECKTGQIHAETIQHVIIEINLLIISS